MKKRKKTLLQAVKGKFRSQRIFANSEFSDFAAFSHAIFGGGEGGGPYIRATCIKYESILLRSIVSNTQTGTSYLSKNDSNLDQKGW